MLEEEKFVYSTKRSLKPKFIEEGPGEKQKAFKLLRIAQNVSAGCVGFFLSERQEFRLNRRR